LAHPATLGSFPHHIPASALALHDKPGMRTQVTHGKGELKGEELGQMQQINELKRLPRTHLCELTIRIRCANPLCESTIRIHYTNPPGGSRKRWLEEQVYPSTKHRARGQSPKAG
jgi:hypothetical protein